LSLRGIAIRNTVDETCDAPLAIVTRPRTAVYVSGTTCLYAIAEGRAIGEQPLPSQIARLRCAS
jgi:hypothetical protein